MFMRMIYDEKLAQSAYLIGCQRTGEAIIFDPERDIDRYVELARANGLRIVAVAETHIHADFLSGAREFAAQEGAKVYVSGEGGPDWTSRWLQDGPGGAAYDHRELRDGDRFTIGLIEFQVVHTPGHTPEHISFLVTDRGGGAGEPMGMVTGDFVFVGDLGRPDLLETAAGASGAMEPAARTLFRSLERLREVPEFVQVWPGHGAGSACGKALGAVPTSTVGYELRFNTAILAAETERGFVDAILAGQPEPPLYFARMKRENRDGPAVLGALPLPRRMGVDDVRALDGRHVAIIDTRPWEAFRSGHIPGALSLPLRPSFNTDAGSLVSFEEEIYLVIEAWKVAEAIRDLVRIGLDRIEGWFDANEVEAYDRAGAPLATIPEVTAREASTMLDDPRVQVLDVRRAVEFAEGHLPGAINVAHTRLAARLEDVPGDRHLVVNCRTGQRSARACSFLQRRGYQVTNLAGGAVAWEQEASLIQR